MNKIVPRTCTEIPSQDSDPGYSRFAKPLEEFRSAAAYILLGGPGSGKTTVFKTESGALGDGAYFIAARDFLTLDPENHPEWRGKTLFIDGLDEIRAGAYDARTPLDEIRRRLDNLGRPRFRISCRDADWPGENDRKRLACVSEDSAVTVLHIDPLTDSEVVSILRGYLAVPDAQEFIVSAEERGVGELLWNPQSLNLLITVVAEEGTWPESRLETFEKACSRIVRGHNEEHGITIQQYDSSQLLGAAGYLCAVLLICGAAGFSHDSDSEDEEHLDLDQCSYGDREALGAALSTKLFEADVDNCRFVPVHRHIAEFLGARYLARLVDQGVPPRRILALITGENGIVVTGMSNLCAWLAVHRGEIRTNLIRCNPVGIFLYGDTAMFSNDENMVLLESLCRERYRTGSIVRTIEGYRTLTAPRMEAAFRNVLTSPHRGMEHQKLTEFVLYILERYKLTSGFSEILLEIVRDNTWLPYINELALDVFIRGCPEYREDLSELKVLLADIRDGNASDPNGELLGKLLFKLYPGQLSPSDIWDYFYEPAAGQELECTYLRFWQIAFLEEPSDDQEVEELLDSLWQRISGLQTAFDAWLLNDLPLKLLFCGLQMHGDRIDRGRLYNWLGVGLSDYAKHDEYCLEPVSRIRAWLEQRPGVQKAIFEEGLDRCPESDEFSYCALNTERRMYGASPPPDFGLWCLRKAVAMAERNPQVSRYFLTRAAEAHKYQNGNEGLSLEILLENAGCNEDLLKELEDPLAQLELSRETPHRGEVPGYEEKGGREDQRWIEYVHANKRTLRGNSAHPGLLLKIAEIYFGHFYYWHDYYGPENIKKWLPGHPDLVEAALSGLRGTIEREDVPDDDKIFDLLNQGKVHSLGLPFLAGLAEVERTTPQDSSRWDETRIRRALLFYYLSDVDNYEPGWYLQLLESRPEIVADLQARFAVSGFRNGRENISKLRELARESNHARVACITSLRLLRSFPSQCNLNHLRNLDYLLWAALKHADREALGGLVAKKLGMKSLNVAQRARWLATGLIVHPAIYRDRLEAFARGSEVRVRHLAAFLSLGGPRLFLLSELEIPELELLVRLVGSYFEPALSLEFAVSTPEKQFSDLVYDLIEHLAAKGAGDALDRLQADPIPKRSHYILARMSEVHRTTCNDVDYRHPDVTQVCRTFSNEAPANAADLAALLVDRLSEVPEKTRTDNTDCWRRYWNEDLHGQPLGPKHEDSCRDILLSDLRGLLPKGVDARPEGRYVDDNRADIVVSYGDFRVPVEIKKNGSRDLLGSVRNQSIALYTRDPATNGYGIYLVLWFGKEYSNTPPSGRRPRDFQELRESIESVLSEDELLKVSVCVIDVSGGE